jgi:hypothetical protein
MMLGKTLLWLDDRRNPFDENWYDLYCSSFDRNNITWVKNFDEFVNYIEENGLPDYIGFDHDLGPGKSGYDCALYLTEYCLDEDYLPPKFFIQSDNPVGKENIDRLIKNLYKHILINREDL